MQGRPIRARVVRSTAYEYMVSIRAEDGGDIRKALTDAGLAPGDLLEIRPAFSEGDKDE